MAIKKPHNDLSRLFKRLRVELPGLVLEPSSLRAPIETRYSPLEVRFEYEPAARALRIYVALPTPVGAGMEFLRWCLSMNTLYWDVKTGLDTEGRLLVLSDVDLDQGDLPATARTALGRVSAICELIEDDLVEYLVSHRLATPAQLARWTQDDDR
jgi:hypothetical protein